MKYRSILQCLTVSLVLCCGTGRAFAQANFWQQTRSPGWGLVHDLAISPRGDIFAADGQLLRSQDHGVNWTIVLDEVGIGPGNHPVRAVAVNADGDIFAGVGGYGVFRSQDNGESWTSKQLDPPGAGSGSAEALAINAAGDIFAGTGGAQIFRSQDNGESWTAMAAIGSSRDFVRALAINAEGDVFAGTLYPCGETHLFETHLF